MGQMIWQLQHHRHILPWTANSIQVRAGVELEVACVYKQWVAAGLTDPSGCSHEQTDIVRLVCECKEYCITAANGLKAVPQ